MYTREQASLLRKQFYTSLGQYMLPIPSADGEKVNWLNYKTGIKQVFIRIETPDRGAEIGVVVADADDLCRQRFFDKLLEMRRFFESCAGNDWTWEPNAIDEYGKKTSRIYVRLEDVSVLNQQQWPALISFLKPRMVALDAFWCLAKDQLMAG